MNVSHEIRYSVRLKVLLVLLAVSMVSLAITGFVAYAAINKMGYFAESSSNALGDQALKDSTVALENAAQLYLKKAATDQATITDYLFNDVETELAIAKSRAVTLQSLSSSGVLSIPNQSAVSDTNYPGISGLYFRVHGADAAIDDREYYAVARMDETLKTLYEADPDINAVYIATDSGQFIKYPRGIRPDVTYDPRTRIWYTVAKTSGNTTWTGPYVDAAGDGLVMTCSIPLYNQKYGYWVIAADVTVDDINQNILNWTLGSGGYAFLLDSKGDLLSTPNLTAGNVSWNQTYVKENILNSPDPQLQSIGQAMTGGKTGVSRATFNGEDRFIAYAPVPSLNWSVGIAMPVTEIIAPVQAIREKIIHATTTTQGNISNETTRLLEILVAIMLILVAVVIFISYSLAKLITRPLDALTKGTIAIGDGDLDYHVPVLTRDEFGHLADSFNLMASDLKKNIEDLKRTTAEKERYTRELEIAKEIQTSFLPEQVPKISGIDMVAFTLPAQDVGGDFYDFIETGPDKWGLIVADVSGKGIPAALFMALSRTITRICASSEPDPRSAILRANRLIFAESRSCMFVTLFYGVLDSRNKTFTYVDAGHNPVIHLKTGEHPEVTWLRGKGLPLGVEEEMTLEERMVSFHTGDIILMYTDGVTEAENPGHDIFSEERLAEFALAHRNDTAQEFSDALLRAIREFAGPAKQTDDITFLVIRVT